MDVCITEITDTSLHLGTSYRFDKGILLQPNNALPVARPTSRISKPQPTSGKASADILQLFVFENIKMHPKPLLKFSCSPKTSLFKALFPLLSTIWIKQV